MADKATNYDELGDLLVDLSNALYDNKAVITRATIPFSQQHDARLAMEAWVDDLCGDADEGTGLAGLITRVREAQHAFEGTDHDPFGKSAPSGTTTPSGAKRAATRGKATAAATGRVAAAKPKPAPAKAGANKTRGSNGAARTKGVSSKGAKGAKAAGPQVEVPA